MTYKDMRLRHPVSAPLINEWRINAPLTTELKSGNEPLIALLGVIKELICE